MVSWPSNLLSALIQKAKPFASKDQGILTDDLHWISWNFNEQCYFENMTLQLKLTNYAQNKITITQVYVFIGFSITVYRIFMKEA